MMEDLLRLANEWWMNKEISEEKAKQYHREIFSDISKLLKYRQIVILTGLRRVGKSTLLFQVIKKVLKKTNEKNILF